MSSPLMPITNFQPENMLRAIQTLIGTYCCSKPSTNPFYHHPREENKKILVPIINAIVIGNVGAYENDVWKKMKFSGDIVFELTKINDLEEGNKYTSTPLLLTNYSENRSSPNLNDIMTKINSSKIEDSEGIQALVRIIHGLFTKIVSK